MRPITPKALTSSLAAVAVVVVASMAFAACGGSSSTGSSSDAPTQNDSSGGDTSQVLPVTENPITNDSTVQALEIDSVLVENNVDSKKKVVADHLEIALQNTGSSPLSNIEVYYTFRDPKANITESYYAKLPDSFTIPAGGKRIAHFDDTGAPDHFPVNKFSLYSTSRNALDVTVVVSATDAAVQTATTQKDAGGEENPAE